MSPTRQVTVLEREEIEELRTGSNNLATMLSKLIPGMADSSRTVTDFGQTLRGRGTLVLVDGIPLNTNRDSARNLATIDPSIIERIEVQRGSSAPRNSTIGTTPPASRGSMRAPCLRAAAASTRSARTATSSAAA